MTKKLSLFMLLAGVLVACNSYAPVQSTATSISSPTAAPLPIFTSTPEIKGIELLKVKFLNQSNGTVIMKEDGSLVEIINGAEYPVPGIYGIGNNGKLGLLINSQTNDILELEDEQWLVDEFGLMIPGYIFNYQTKQWGKIPNKDFGSAPLSEYRQNLISPEDLFNGSYCEFVKRKFTHTFVLGEYKDVSRQYFGAAIVYNYSTSPNFPADTVTPFAWKETAAYMPVTLPDGRIWEFMILPILYPDSNPLYINKPSFNICVPAVISKTRPHDPDRTTTGASDIAGINMLMNDMNAPMFETKAVHPGFGVPVPFLVDIYDIFYGTTVMHGKFESFVSGNNRALSNTPVYFVIGKSALTE